MHLTALGSLEKLLANDDAVYVPPQNIVEFWNVCTRPAAVNGLGLSAAEAHAETSRLEALLTLLPEIPAIYPEWRRLVVLHSVAGAQVHDARIVAAMKVFGITNILTFNGSDFTRYPDLHVVHPTQIVEAP